MEKNILKLNYNNNFVEVCKENGVEYLNNILNDSQTPYRFSLGLPDDLTFGIEIEYELIDELFVFMKLHEKYQDWFFKDDFSIKLGGETSSPIFSDNYDTWQTINNICCDLKKLGAAALDCSGGHIHIGSNLLGDDYKAWLNFIKIYIAYENVFTRFFYGDKLCARSYKVKNLKTCYEVLRNFHYGYSVENVLGIINNNNYDLYQFLLNLDPYTNVNCLNIGYVFENHMGNTVEFRSPNGTLNENVWQNNINACTKLLLASKKKIDNDYLDFKIKNIPEDKKDYYDNININDALELVDLIFENNLDKIYFLKQYFKYDIYSENHKSLTKSI